ITQSVCQKAAAARRGGQMISAAAARADATKNTKPLALAHDVAAFMLAHETASVSGGTILTDPQPCNMSCSLSKGAAVRYLAALYAADRTHTEYLALLLRSARSAIANARDASSWLFAKDWSSPFLDGELDAQTSAAALLSAVARFGPAAPDNPADRYEAEEAVIHTLLLENIYSGYSSWGYVA